MKCVMEPMNECLGASRFKTPVYLRAGFLLESVSRLGFRIWELGTARKSSQPMIVMLCRHIDEVLFRLSVLLLALFADWESPCSAQIFFRRL
jgi:hypothetical protein